MFSSNQVFDVLCGPEQLPGVIALAMELYGAEKFTRSDGRMRTAFAELKDAGTCPGIYLVGCGSMEPYKTGPNKGWAAKLPAGWTDYPFDYDPDLIARIVAQWAAKQEIERPSIDGSVEKGIRAMSIVSAHGNGPLPRPWPVPGLDVHGAVLAFAAWPLEYHK